MSLFYRRLLLLLLLTVFTKPEAVQAQQPVHYQYMHIFYYGTKTAAGTPALTYVPAFNGQKDVTIKDPEILLRLNKPFSGKSRVSTSTSSAEGTWITDENGKSHKQTPEETKKASQLEADQRAEYTRAVSVRTELVHDAITQALNSTAAGWEVVQMVSVENGGLVYLLRKPS
ncbi:hypothetical protein [Hymenobacter sp. GOD-10R]|uniref:hypothetical protein n=1 Tax=Hymenobacter sp. GOD-10R TaxID=3093922 RepID=UPI002D79E0B8|nr:hypothetical protein [Hymenobacter sp. GOD-10R]WRQ29338.1 hypothetical protein SD425_03555 [Hymenobacter sp. GOD-10R]